MAIPHLGAAAVRSPDGVAPTSESDDGRHQGRRDSFLSFPVAAQGDDGLWLAVSSQFDKSIQAGQICGV